MTNWQVLKFSGDGGFDHEADTREAALVLVLPRPDPEFAVFYFLSFFLPLGRDAR